MVVGIKYTEGAGQDSYEKVYVYWMDTDLEESRKEFDSGDFLKDWNEAMQWIRDNNNDGLVMGSSTCDTFFEEEPQRYKLLEGKAV